MSNNKLEITDALHPSQGAQEVNFIVRARTLDRIASQAREAAERQGKNPEIEAHRAVAPGKMGIVASGARASGENETALGNLVAARLDNSNAPSSAPRTTSGAGSSPTETD